MMFETLFSMLIGGGLALLVFSLIDGKAKPDRQGKLPDHGWNAD
jgi:hypothetical protein